VAALVGMRLIPVYPIRAYLLERRPASSTTIMTTMLQKRALWPSNRVEMSVAHRLLLALCQRAVGGLVGRFLALENAPPV
jgi:hypothetical protein